MNTRPCEKREATEWLVRALMSRHSAAMQAAAVSIVAAAAACPAPSSAQVALFAEYRLAGLEKGFWACDYAAATGPLDGGTAMNCGSLTEALKLRKFDGDFNAMLAWWRQHKEVEHMALARAGTASLLPPMAQTGR